MSKVVFFAIVDVFTKDGMAGGPDLRTWEMAKGVSRAGHDVTISVFKNKPQKQEQEGIKFNAWTKSNLDSISGGFDVAIIQQSPLAHILCEKLNLPIILDCFDPTLIEGLSYQQKNKQGFYSWSRHLSRAVKTFKNADLFLAATGRQKDYYNGVLSILGRLNPVNYQDDFIKIVPTGVPADKLEAKKSVIRSSVVPEYAKVILWAGGAYPWFDLPLMLKAMPAIKKREPKAKLVVMGANNPRTGVSTAGLNEAMSLAKELDLLNKDVFFVDWQPYYERYNVYSEVDIVVNTHKELIETDYSFRTRLTDYIWAELPIITTGGDEISKMLQERNAGVVFGCSDQKALENSVCDLLDDEARRDELKQNVRKVKADLSWDKVVQSFLPFVENPHKASDLMNADARKTFLKTIGAKYNWWQHLVMLNSYFWKSPDKFSKLKEYLQK